MRPDTEARPQDPRTDGDPSRLQRVFGTDPHQLDDQNHVRDAEEATADPARPEAQWYADEQTTDDQPRDEAARHDEQPEAGAEDVAGGARRMDGVGDIHRDDDDDDGTTHHDETAGFDQPVDLEPGTDDATVDEPAAHPGVAEATSLDESTDLKPGDVPATLVAAIWTEDSAQDLRERWREAQLRFVDDPRKVAEDTRDLLNDAVEALTAALSSHREQLNDWPTNRDTEQYRVLVQRYRTFFERLLTL